MTLRSPSRLLARAAVASLLWHAAAYGTKLDLVVQREPGHTLSGTLFEVAGDTPDTPRLSIGIQSVIQSGMPSYSELLTVYVRNDGAAAWRDLGQPFERGNYVWLVALDNRLIALDRQDIAPPRRLVSTEPPQWETLGGTELIRLEQYLGRSRSILRRPRLMAGEFSVQILDVGKIEICRLPAVSGASCRQHALPQENDVVYTVARDEGSTVLFANEGWFRLEPDGTLRSTWLQADEPRLSNQVYTAVRTNRGVLLGHYPTGNVLKMMVSGGRVSAAPAFGVPPYTAPARRSDREVQSLVRYGGKLLAGVWPWGEMYSFDAGAGWTLVRRLFPAPRISDGLAPYAEAIAADGQSIAQLRRRLSSILPGWARSKAATSGPSAPEDDPDVWGQRVTQLVPLGTGLYVATGNKSGEYEPAWLKFLPSPALAADYGKVYEMTAPGNLACNLPPYQNRIALSIEVGHQRLEVRADGKLLCSLADDSIGAAAKLLGTGGMAGDGSFGKLLGGQVRVTSKVQVVRRTHAAALR